MKNLRCQLLGFFVGTVMLSSTALADVQPQRVHVKVKGEASAACTSLADSLRFHFKSRLRFKLSDEPQASHLITLACTAKDVDAVWTRTWSTARRKSISS